MIMRPITRPLIRRITGPVDDVGIGDGLGPELITNGDFSSAAGWTVGVGWNIANAAQSINGGILSQLGVLTASKTYRLIVRVTAYTSGALIFTDGVTSFNIPSAIGTHTIVLPAVTGSDATFQGGGTYNGIIDDVSIRELVGV